VTIVWQISKALSAITINQSFNSLIQGDGNVIIHPSQSLGHRAADVIN